MRLVFLLYLILKNLVLVIVSSKICGVPKMFTHLFDCGQNFNFPYLGHRMMCR